MEYKNNISPIPQYSLRETLLIWAVAAIPMGILGWFVAPALALKLENQGYVFFIRFVIWIHDGDKILTITPMKSLVR